VDGNLPGFLPLKGFKGRFTLLGPSTLQSISDLAASQLASIEASADFLKFKTSPHQDLSLSLKATSVRLACISFIAGNEEPSTLPSLVKSILIDSSQMTHDELSLACLDTLAAISMNCQEYSGEFNRSLRSYIVHTHGLPTIPTLSTSKTTIAAKRLAWCLSAVSNDKIVSTLYTLVNVLAPSTSTADRSVVSLRPRTALSLMQQEHTSSSISLSLKSEDQRQQVYSNVIEAIAAIVCEIKDEKIAELMISLLGQKFGRVNEGVDKSLVWGLATISKTVKEKDFRRILKLHAKVRLDPSTASISLTETVSTLVKAELIF
jgi:phosphatidylinositol 4-kinase